MADPQSTPSDGTDADSGRPTEPEVDEADSARPSDPDGEESDPGRAETGIGVEPDSRRQAETGPEDATEVEEKYDFDDFDPRQMEQMTVDEWEVAFDDDSWITGDELLDRVADDLRSQIASREVFAVLEEVEHERERRLLAYSDEGYALVYPDGTIEGFGTALRDVKPTVALCSMDSYDPPDPPEDRVLLPDPQEVPEASGEFGNLMLQVVAGTLILAGLALVVAWLVAGLSVVAPAAGLFFVLVGLFLFASVANARLSDRFRAEEYRERLRAVGLADGERPDFLPVEDGEVIGHDEREPRPLADNDSSTDVDGAGRG
jgi:hypothetical protein